MPPAYVAGEETAVVRAIDGGPALPLDKPPRPFESGVEGSPTLVANVETLANVPASRYAAPSVYRERRHDQLAGHVPLDRLGRLRAPGPV